MTHEKNSGNKILTDDQKPSKIIEDIFAPFIDILNEGKDEKQKAVKKE